ncbi:MAG: type IV pilus assembly protein PilM [Actinobacteria bacterium]|nr:MAG: type IV pilus assembly protein PilM [Actinomycetota bacterium]
MPVRSVGLDIGTHAVRAAEMALGRGDQPVLNRFGQVALPLGAVSDGEVVDPPAVAAAIRRLWTEAGFKGRDVVVGVANQRVIVRQADLPAMAEEDLRSALRYQVQELIPIPVDEAILDFQIVEQFVGPEQEPMMRILLVAAQSDMVRSLLAAIDGAGLSASLVDVIPFALIRALASTELSFGETGPANEAIVCVGGGVTNVVVHERGVPRFVRMLITGGNEITEAIASELHIDPDTAEDLKRRADAGSADELEARAGRITTDRLSPFVEEVRGSIDYYRAQAADGGEISRVLLTGGGSQVPGLADRLRQVLHVPVEIGHPLLGVRVGRVGIPEDRLIDSEPLLTVPIGLALAGHPTEGAARRMSLLPPDVAVVRERRRQSSLVVVSVVVLAVLLLVAYVGRRTQVSSARDKAERAEAAASALRQDAARLSQVTTVDTQLQERRAMVESALSDDVAWTRLLQEIATVLPNDVWLTAFTGQKSSGQAPVRGSAPSAGTTGVGSINVTGQGFDQSSAARWLLRVGDLQSLSGLWLSSSTRSGENGGTVTFSSTATLTPQAKSGNDRRDKYLGGGS